MTMLYTHSTVHISTGPRFFLHASFRVQAAKTPGCCTTTLWHGAPLCFVVEGQRLRAAAGIYRTGVCGRSGSASFLFMPYRYRCAVHVPDGCTCTCACSLERHRTTPMGVGQGADMRVRRRQASAALMFLYLRRMEAARASWVYVPVNVVGLES